MAIAGECGGFDVFIEKMNAKAAELGLTDTHFDNPNGLSSETPVSYTHLDVYKRQPTIDVSGVRIS